MQSSTGPETHAGSSTQRGRRRKAPEEYSTTYSAIRAREQRAKQGEKEANDPALRAKRREATRRRAAECRERKKGLKEGLSLSELPPLKRGKKIHDLSEEPTPGPSSARGQEDTDAPPMDEPHQYPSPLRSTPSTQSPTTNNILPHYVSLPIIDPALLDLHSPAPLPRQLRDAAVMTDDLVPLPRQFRDAAVMTDDLVPLPRQFRDAAVTTDDLVPLPRQLRDAAVTTADLVPLPRQLRDTAIITDHFAVITVPLPTPPINTKPFAFPSESRSCSDGQDLSPLSPLSEAPEPDLHTTNSMDSVNGIQGVMLPEVIGTVKWSGGQTRARNHLPPRFASSYSRTGRIYGTIGCSGSSGGLRAEVGSNGTG